MGDELVLPTCIENPLVKTFLVVDPRNLWTTCRRFSLGCVIKRARRSAAKTGNHKKPRQQPHPEQATPATSEKSSKGRYAPLTRWPMEPANLDTIFANEADTQAPVFR
jgi:hypothetical protein